MNDEVLRQGASGDDVSELQTHLHQLNFYAGTIDGYFGPTTEEAVTAYREWSGAGHGTELEPELRAALAAHVEQYVQPEGVEPPVDVTDLQTHLHQLNFYAGTFDGQLGPVTEAALAAYREWSGLGADTELDQLRTTLAAHAEQYANQDSETAATETAATETAPADQPKPIPPVANDEIDDAETEEAPAPDLEDAVL